MARGGITGDWVGRSGRALALAWFVFAALLFLVATLTTLFGERHPPPPSVREVLVYAPAYAAMAPTPARGALSQSARTPEPLPPPGNADARALIADPSLIEETPFGPLPRIASDGRRPMTAYAGAQATLAGRARIAIVITDLGISAKQTADAVRLLPAPVTLAFAPYADDVQRFVSAARKAGHEVLVQIPMEPDGPHDSDPGPHTLRTGAAGSQNGERLVWVLSRFTGYAGVTNMQGGRFLADQGALAPALGYMAKRGLLFFDDGEVADSAAPAVAAQVGMAYLRSTMRIESLATAPDITARLTELESQARGRGWAAGTISLTPATLQCVSKWASGLNAHGFVLVPASAIVAAARAG